MTDNYGHPTVQRFSRRMGERCSYDTFTEHYRPPGRWMRRYLQAERWLGRITAIGIAVGLAAAILNNL